MLKGTKVTAAVLALGTALLTAGCWSSSPAQATGSRDAVPVVAGENEYAQRDRPDRRPLCERVLRRLEPEHRPAHVSRPPRASPRRSPRPADRTERDRLRRLHDQDRLGVAELGPQGDRRAAPARPAGWHANPHLWYDPKTMPAVAKALAADLSALDPAHAPYFQANETKFVASLKPWFNAIAAFKAKYPRTPVATTEPVADYLLKAMGIDNLTPFSSRPTS